MTTHSHLEREALGQMRGEPGAALRLACEEFEKFWLSVVKNHPPASQWNPELEATVKRIARVAFLEGRGL